MAQFQSPLSIERMSGEQLLAEGHAAINGSPIYSTFIYAFSMGEFCKIGLTVNLDQRLKHYRTHCPLDLTVGFAQEVLTKHARKFEAAVHRKLAKYRTKGEWFRVPPEKAERAITAVRKEMGLPKYVKPQEPPHE